MKYACVASIAVLLVACGSDPSKPSPASSSTAAVKNDASNGIICTKEAIAGTIVRKNVCTTPEEREAARRRAAMQMEGDAVRSGVR